MKIFGLIGVLVLTAACNNAAPTATGYKQQLGAPAAVTGTGNATTGGAGDIEKGKTAFTASCAGCHGPDAASPLDGSEDIAAGFGANSAHTAFKNIFDTNAADISAYLKSVNGGTPAAAAGDAAKGEALIKAQCIVCHTEDGAGMGPKLDQFANIDGQIATSPTRAAIHGDAITKTITDNLADIKAALKARP
jgi:mono/diheme cytochrome c family protein